MRVFVMAALLLMPVSAGAQAEARDEPRASELREQSRQRVRDGRLEEAFDLLREATNRTEDPTVWLEVAELADRLRLDTIALQAYETYLLRRTDAPDRAEIEGRVRVLREIVAGGRYLLETGTGRNVLVDWYGRPLVLRRSTGLISLASWEGSVPASPPAPRALPELMPFRATPVGLGRRLAVP